MISALLNFKFYVSAKSGSDPEIPQRLTFRIFRVFELVFPGRPPVAATFS
jgi:hypothetical protein